jgi:hypothetical protein
LTTAEDLSTATLQDYSTAAPNCRSTAALNNIGLRGTRAPSDVSITLDGYPTSPGMCAQEQRCSPKTLETPVIFPLTKFTDNTNRMMATFFNTMSMYLPVRDPIDHHNEYGAYGFSIAKIDHIRKQSTHTPFLRLLPRYNACRIFPRGPSGGDFQGRR